MDAIRRAYRRLSLPGVGSHGAADDRVADRAAATEYARAHGLVP